MGRDGRDGRDSFRIDPSDPTSATIEELVATVSGDAKHTKLTGTITFRAQGGNVMVDTVVDGLPKGEHGYHVHVYGDCSNLSAKSPGEHFDFRGGMGGHGDAHEPPAAGSGSGAASAPATTASHIVGNLGELNADDKGHAAATMAVDTRLRPLVGRSVVIHERRNDESQPDGAAGDPIACGVIGIANPDDKASASTSTSTEPK
jgi:Cu-Zn family superoxide dismutase